jgi:hypothetical protein
MDAKVASRLGAAAVGAARDHLDVSVKPVEAETDDR